MSHSLIRTFAQTFSFPYTETLQELPPLEDNRHLHLGALADFYCHMDGTWHSDNPLANYWLVFTMGDLSQIAQQLARLGLRLG